MTDKEMKEIMDLISDSSFKMLEIIIKKECEDEKHLNDCKEMHRWVLEYFAKAMRDLEDKVWEYNDFVKNHPRAAGLIIEGSLEAIAKSMQALFSSIVNREEKDLH